MSVLSKSALAGLGLSLIAAFPQVAGADGYQAVSSSQFKCNHSDVIENYLKKKFQQVKKYSLNYRIEGRAALIDVYASKAGSWSHVSKDTANNVSCILYGGKNHFDVASESRKKELLTESTEKQNLKISECSNMRTEGLSNLAEAHNNILSEGKEFHDVSVSPSLGSFYTYVSEDGNWTTLRDPNNDGNICHVNSDNGVNFNTDYVIQSVLAQANPSVES